MASEWGVTHTVVPADNSARNSAWGYAATVVPASAENRKSPWTISNLKMYEPHHPIGVLMPGNVMKYIPIQTLINGVLK